MRASLPPDWRIADRTGAGGHGTRNVPAAMGPPGGEATVAAVDVTGTEASSDLRNAAIAAVGRGLLAVLRS